MVRNLTTAEIALGAAMASAAISLAGLAWQMRLYRLSGARLEVRLISALHTEAGNLLRAERGWRGKAPPDLNFVQGRPWADLAIIHVINIGRCAVSVSNIGLDFGPHPRWKPWVRHTMTGKALSIHGGATDVDDVRIKPGAMVAVVIDPWPLIEQARKRRERVVVRGSAGAAGRRSAPQRLAASMDHQPRTGAPLAAWT